jgi:agmatinase
MAAFDPNAAARPGSGIFGLPHDETGSAVVLVPVPFAATVSYGGGAERGPAAILQASAQVDLFDHQYGRAYEAGIHMQAADPRLLPAHERARALAAPILARGGAGTGDARAVAEVDAAGALVTAIVRERTAALLAAGRIPGVVGGDHSVPLGAIAAVAAVHPGLGILHVDAHADLRRAYEGFRYSHASIMDNVLREVPGVARLVQVGIRDFGEDELQAIHGSDGRVLTHFDQEWRRRLFAGDRYDALCREAIAALPAQVYVSVDIDGLDPTLCPHTGTPVPGGLSFAEFAHLLAVLAGSGRRIVGFDLVEVAPGDGDGEWDGAVGARALYKLCGAALRARSP